MTDYTSFLNYLLSWIDKTLGQDGHVPVLFVDEVERFVAIQIDDRIAEIEHSARHMVMTFEAEGFDYAFPLDSDSGLLLRDFVDKLLDDDKQ